MPRVGDVNALMVRELNLIEPRYGLVPAPKSSPESHRESVIFVSGNLCLRKSHLVRGGSRHRRLFGIVLLRDPGATSVRLNEKLTGEAPVPRLPPV